MRRNVQLALAMAVSLAAAPLANAAINVSSTEVAVNAALTANGWAGYLIVLTSTTAAEITTVDLTNTNAGIGLIGAGGIYGPVMQRWILDTSAEDGGTIVRPTPVSAASTFPATINLRNDSVFLNSAYYNVSVADPFVEDNNGTNTASAVPPVHGATPNDVAAVADVDNSTFSNGANYGTGSAMHFTGASNPANLASTTLNLAFVIAPKGLGNVLLSGFAIDQNGQSTVYNSFVVNPVPEPASLGVLALGGVALLVRRRKA